MELCPTTHLTLHCSIMDTLLDWYRISRHEITRGFDTIPSFGVQFLQEMEIWQLEVYDYVLLIKLIIKEDKTGTGQSIVELKYVANTSHEESSYRVNVLSHLSCCGKSWSVHQ